MTTMLRQRRQLAAVLLAFLGAACGDATAPDRGTLQVLVQTTGGDLDLDGYDVVVDSTVRRPVPIFGEATVSDLRPGTYAVALARVAPNCTVSGTHPRLVTVAAGRTVDVAFKVECATTGIEIRTRTAGYSVPPSHQVEVVNDQVRFIAPNGSLVVGRLDPGPRAVTLTVRGEHCTVAGGRTITVEVVRRTVTPVLFDVTCVVPTRLEKIAYVAEVTTNGIRTNRLTLVRPDGSGAVDLDAGTSPAWSPDGTRLALSTVDCDFYYGCNDAVSVLDPETRSIFSVPGAGGGLDPAWAPSGDRIAYGCCATGAERLVVARLDGSPPVALGIQGVARAGDPTWSPDGERIAFACVVTLPNEDVCVVKKDGTGLVRLTSGDASETNPAWSPDGRRIAFTSAPTVGRPEIALMASDGTAVTRLTEGSEPAWSRDGRKLVFAGRDGLFTINVDGSSLTRLTTGSHHAPAWRP